MTITEQERTILKIELEEYRKEAEKLGLALQEYLLLRILEEVQQIPYQKKGSRSRD